MAKTKNAAATKSQLTSRDKERYEQGLRALARLIARAYLSEMDVKKVEGKS